MTNKNKLLLQASVAIAGLLTVSVAASGQAASDDRFSVLHQQRLQAAELALSQGTVVIPVVAASGDAPQPSLALASNAVPVWARGLSAAAWEQMVKTFEAEGVPLELLAVGWVESRFDPQALSPKGARGIWQFMPETARLYGLRVGNGHDDRTNLTLSTRAAARHLADLYRQFGDWPLALAAYNAGAERIDAAVTRAGTRDFWNLRPWLPTETQDYVPAVLRTTPNRFNARDRSREH